MAVFVLNEQTQNELARIKAHAEAHPLLRTGTVDHTGTYKPSPAPGDQPEHRGFKLPPVPVAIEVMKLLGYLKPLTECRVHVESLRFGQAINIVELIPK